MDFSRGRKAQLGAKQYDYVADGDDREDELEELEDNSNVVSLADYQYVRPIIIMKRRQARAATQVS